MFGPPAATLVVALDSLIISLWIHRTSRRLERILFNLSAPTVSVWIAAQVFFQISGVRPLADQPQPIVSLLLPLLVLAIVYFLLNSWLIAFAVALEQKLSAFVIWRKNFLWLSLNYFSGASIAALLLPYLQGSDPIVEFLRAIALLLPLLIITYLTLKTSLGRVEDATKHLSQLNHLYLSTIETLAMAIDAKDQITSGHIRRVQIMAVRLAKAMGVRDSVQIRAVEAAALLHDMGKLAVPEYILNKPGPLTAAEFDKMKLHASVGADILSAIDFPYPVVPIVRHHHENWNGTGYPDGLKGSDIPIGARILSVVDCFDALTSDRPYRGKLADEEALRILGQRRGTMYDPLVVDTFVQVYRDIAPSDAELAQEELSTLHRSKGPANEIAPLGHSQQGEVNASKHELGLVYEIARALSGRVTLSEVAEIAYRQFKHVMPATTCVFFAYDAITDELVPAHVAGGNAAHFADLRIPMGLRLSGWVAANRQVVMNSDPMLDLGEAARVLKPSLRSCLSAPVIADRQLVGVLTAYSSIRDGFNDEHRRVLELVARQLSESFRRALTAAENRTQLNATKSAEPPKAVETVSPGDLSVVDGAPCSILLLELETYLDGEAQTGSDAERLVARVARTVASVLRTEDLIFRSDFSRIVILLPRSNGEDAERVAEQVARSVRKSLGESAGISTIRLGLATAPDDALTVWDLLSVAETHLMSLTSGGDSVSIH
jgi:putative nucleotidyltransferase with HDIG domain